jgi:hypothetical protein
MRSVLSSGWTDLVLLLAGTYLLGFAGTAMATDWQNQGQQTTQSNRKCVALTYWGGSCTNFDNLSCYDRNPAPNITGCTGYRYFKRSDFRPHGNCELSITSTCLEAAWYHCAHLQFYDRSDCTYSPNVMPCFTPVYVQNGCDPADTTD